MWDGDELVFTVEDRGNVHIHRVAAAGAGAAARVLVGLPHARDLPLGAGAPRHVLELPDRLARAAEPEPAHGAAVLEVVSDGQQEGA